MEDIKEPKTLLPSKYQIGHNVTYLIEDHDSDSSGVIVAVRFTKSKVFYDILDDYYGVLVRDIDSAIIE